MKPSFSSALSSTDAASTEDASLLPDVEALLRRAHLRPTQQRLALARLLFCGKDWHVTAETLHAQACEARLGISLATIYNTLHQFTQRGLLKQLSLSGSRTYFDTNLDEHHHFFVEGTETVIDIPKQCLPTNTLPAVPTGMEIVQVDVVLRLRPVKER